MIKNYKILLFGHGSYLNRGCEAIVVATGKGIKRLNSNHEISVATFDLGNDAKFKKDLINNYVSHRWRGDELSEEEERKVQSGLDRNEFLHQEVVEEIKKSDICISIGGDNYCYENNFEWLNFIDKRVKKEGKKLVLWGASINEDVINDRFIEDIRLFDVILVRESLTYELLSPYLDKNKLLMQPDPAFSLIAKEVSLPDGFKNNKEVVGLNLSSLILNYQGKDADVVSGVYELIDHILKTYSFGIALVPHVYIKGSDDTDLLKNIKEKYNTEERIFVLDQKEYESEELKYLISKCKFLIAARTHASIAGYSTGVPTLVLGYSIKSKGIAKDIFGDYRDYVLPVQDLNDPKLLIDKFDMLVNKEAGIRKILQNKMPMYKKKAEDLAATVINKVEELESNNVTRREVCTGCTACKNSCPKLAIEMKNDKEGFGYPVIDKTKCIECNICRKVCPNNKNYHHNFAKLKAYASKNVDETARLISSSGGIFSLLAKNVLAEGGVVFGAAYENYDVRHIQVDKEEDLLKILGSKYVESSIGNTFIDAKAALEGGSKVLFSGVPCQIEGLRGFLKKDYPNLYCVSVFCHGVPGKKVFINHLRTVEKEYSDKLLKVNFRNKSNGWKKYQIEYIFKTKNISRYFRDDEYIMGFLENYYLRQSCYSCDFRLTNKNTSDLILGDFWGIEKELPEFDDDKGTSAIIVNSAKGATLLNKIKNNLSIKEVAVEQVVNSNSTLVRPVNLNLYRFEFFELFNKLGLKFAVDYFKKKTEFDQIAIRLKETEGLIAEEQSKTEGIRTEFAKIVNSKRWKLAMIAAESFNKLLPHNSFQRKALVKSYRRVVTRYKKSGEKSEDPKLVMTILARNEADIIRQNLEFHLNKGVDFIIATDNGSTDGTREIFEEYAKKGVLHLIDENNQNHFQSKWVNRMGEIAYKKYKADIILHCDADEFWVPQSGNLKTEIWNSPEDILYVNLAHVLLEYDEGKESFPKNTKWAVINPIVAANPAEESKKQNYYLLKNPPRLIFKTRGKLYKVGEGNDSITNGDDRMIFSDDIIIYHFPLRNKEQFFNKIPLAGAALTSNKKFKERVGWHWRRWYQSYLKGNLEKEYLKLVITREEAVKLEETGVVTEIDFNDLTKNLIPSKAGHK